MEIQETIAVFLDKIKKDAVFSERSLWYALKGKQHFLCFFKK